jgi:hypothetical protein
MAAAKERAARIPTPIPDEDGDRNGDERVFEGSGNNNPATPHSTRSQSPADDGQEANPVHEQGRRRARPVGLSNAVEFAKGEAKRARLDEAGTAGIVQFSKVSSCCLAKQNVHMVL